VEAIELLQDGSWNAVREISTTKRTPAARAGLAAASEAITLGSDSDESMGSEEQSDQLSDGQNDEGQAQEVSSEPASGDYFIHSI